MRRHSLDPTSSACRSRCATGAPHPELTRPRTALADHANNAGLLTKTTLEGEIVWQREGNFGQDPKAAYRPTWFGVPPATRSKYIYLCDGYGSNNVYVFDRDTGAYMNKVYGGKGGRDQHGKFSTNHGCLWDARVDKIAVADRAN